MDAPVTTYVTSIVVADFFLYASVGLHVLHIIHWIEQVRVLIGTRNVCWRGYVMLFITPRLFTPAALSIVSKHVVFLHTRLQVFRMAQKLVRSPRRIKKRRETFYKAFYNDIFKFRWLTSNDDAVCDRILKIGQQVKFRKEYCITLLIDEGPRSGFLRHPVFIVMKSAVRVARLDLLCCRHRNGLVQLLKNTKDMYT